MSEIYDGGQPLPITTKKSVDVAVEVAEDLRKYELGDIAINIEERIALGERKYGKRLQSYNGRNAVKDLYDEVLDGLNYSKQMEIEGLDDGTLFKALVTIAAEVKSRLDRCQ
jgi:hypothetical protein